MKNIITALIIGTIAGVIDVIPMIIQGLDSYSCVSAFVHWLVLGLIIPYVNWKIKAWLKGFLIAELTAIPIMLIVFPQDPKALIPIAIFSALLGAAIGITGTKFIKVNQ